MSVFSPTQLRIAVSHCQTEALRQILEIHGDDCSKIALSSALKVAVELGHAESVRLLMVHCTPQSNNTALRMAAARGHTEIVKLLVAVSDPKTQDSIALQVAAQNGHDTCVDVLYPVSDVQTALAVLRDQCPDRLDYWGGPATALGCRATTPCVDAAHPQSHPNGAHCT